MSGFPGKVLTFFLYLSVFQNGFIISPRTFSISVSFIRTFAIKTLLCFFEILSIFFNVRINTASLANKSLSDGYIPPPHGFVPFFKLKKLLPRYLQDFLRS